MSRPKDLKMAGVTRKVKIVMPPTQRARIRLYREYQDGFMFFSFHLIKLRWVRGKNGKNG
jgi:hypothetical protein